MASERKAPALVGETLGTELGEIVVIGSELQLSDPAQRRELIERVLNGEHVELEIEARTFRQKDGEPNRNFLRFKSERLTSIGESFKGMPVLLDHNKWEQSARIGTILESSVELQGHGWTAFKQKLKIVKKEAVVSVLDGTLDRFSIGWYPTAPVLCTVHNVDVRSWKERSKAECYCWPGDKVSVEVDGKKSTQIVEYEFQNAEGIEVSAVNVPAVKGTRIEDVREALALELGLQPFPEGEKERAMSFKLLATALGLTALASAEDEAAAVRAVEDLRRGRLAAEQERDTARSELTAAKESLKADRETMIKTSVDALIEGAYRDGKMRFMRDEAGNAVASPKEARLRRIAKEDGLAGLQAELADMPQIVPVGQRVLNKDDVREREEHAPDDSLSTAADQLGYKPDELADHRAKMIAQKGRR